MTLLRKEVREGVGTLTKFGHRVRCVFYRKDHCGPPITTMSGYPVCHACVHDVHDILARSGVQSQGVAA